MKSIEAHHIGSLNNKKYIRECETVCMYNFTSSGIECPCSLLTPSEDQIIHQKAEPVLN